MAYSPDDLDEVDYGSHELGGHFHADERGYLHRCYHHCRHRPWLWFPMLFMFQILMLPIEHTAAEYVWTTVPFLDQVADFIGWHHG